MNLGKILKGATFGKKQEPRPYMQIELPRTWAELKSESGGTDDDVNLLMRVMVYETLKKATDAAEIAAFGPRPANRAARRRRPEKLTAAPGL